MIKKCSGCGLPLQYKDENKLGYAPKKMQRYVKDALN